MMINRYTAPAARWLRSLSGRERLLIGAGAAVLLPMFLYQAAVVPLREKFKEQSASIEKLQEDYKTIPFILDRYSRFNAKKEQIESEFKEVEIKEGEQSLLENILSEKVDAGFDINPGPSRAFGGSYEQASFNVRFTTQNISNLVDVLTRISTGKKRLIITSLNLTKDPNGEKLRVDLGVSSIRQKT